MFENKVLKGICRHKGKEIKDDGKKVHNEGTSQFFSSRVITGDQIKKDEVGGTCSTYGRHEKCVQELVGQLNVRER
jgi:hypothetical protein